MRKQYAGAAGVPRASEHCGAAELERGSKNHWKHEAASGTGVIGQTGVSGGDGKLMRARNVNWGKFSPKQEPRGTQLNWFRTSLKPAQRYRFLQRSPAAELLTAPWFGC